LLISEHFQCQQQTKSETGAILFKLAFFFCKKKRGQNTDLPDSLDREFYGCDKETNCCSCRESSRGRPF
jgi:hypothetical protein